MRPFHNLSVDLISGKHVQHSVRIQTPSGCIVDAMCGARCKRPKWDVYTAGGELVLGGYEDVTLAVTHALSLYGNLVDMGEWSGPSDRVTEAGDWAHGADAVALWHRVAAGLEALVGDDAKFGHMGQVVLSVA